MSAVYDGGSVVKEGEEAGRKGERERERERKGEREGEREDEREGGKEGERVSWEELYQVGMQFVDTTEQPVCDSIG